MMDQGRICYMNVTAPQRGVNMKQSLLTLAFQGGKKSLYFPAVDQFKSFKSVGWEEDKASIVNQG